MAGRLAPAEQGRPCRPRVPGIELDDETPLGEPDQLDAPECLDHEGVELVIIGAAGEPGRELGLELDPQAEQVHDADLFRDLRIRPGNLPLDPLRSGKLR